MTLFEALKKGGPIKKQTTLAYENHSLGYSVLTTYLTPNSWICPEFLLSVMHFTKEDLLADDWDAMGEK